jgi:hypothetical protein
LPSRPVPARLVIASAVAALACSLIALTFTAGAAAQQSGATDSAQRVKGTVKVKPYGLENGRATIMGRVTVGGSVKPFQPGMRVRVTFFHNARQFEVRRIKVRKAGGDAGKFKTSIITRKGGKYAVQARYPGNGGNAAVAADSSVRKSWKVRFVGLRRGQCGRIVRGFRKALNDMAFVPSKSKCFNGKMERAVLAYRKLNNLGRSARAPKSVVRRIFNREGGYRVRKPGLGDHVEASLSRQVMVFAKGRKPYAIFPIASGAPATPTILGTYRFYWKDPGYNAIGMYYSSYFIRGYAIHGYKSVPNYPASHGCLRTFIADQPRIYRLTRIGQPIHVYGNARSLSPFDTGSFGNGGPDPSKFDAGA